MTEMQQWLAMVGATKGELIPSLMDMKPPQTHEERVRFRHASLRRHMGELFPEMTQSQILRVVLDFHIKEMQNNITNTQL